MRRIPRWARTDWAAAAAVSLVAAIASLGALRNGLFWDDPVLLYRQLPAIAGVEGAFFPPSTLPQWSTTYYRPVVTLSFEFDRALWGYRVQGYHLTVLLLHVLTAGAVCLLAARVLGTGGIGPLIAGLVFALHPVHAEAVAWICGRADILATLFSVMAVIVALEPGKTWPPPGGSPGLKAGGRPRGSSRDRGRPEVRSPGSARRSGRSMHVVCAAASCLLSVAALLSKESAFVLPVLCAVLLWRRGSALGRFLRTLLPVLLGCLIALGVRAFVLGSVVNAGTRVGAGVGAVREIGSAVAFAARRLAAPWWWSGFQSSIGSVGLLEFAGLAVLALVIACACRAGRAGRLAVVFMGIGLLPALGPVLFAVSLSPIADRYLYMASVGFALAIGAIVATGVSTGKRTAQEPHASDHPPVGRPERERDPADRSERLRAAAESSERKHAPAASAKNARTLGSRAGRAGPPESRPERKDVLPIGGSLRIPSFLVASAVGIALIGLALGNASAIARYRDDLTYWSAALAARPRDPYARLQYGSALMTAGKLQEAGRSVQEAIDLGLGATERVIALDHLGEIALREGRLDDAVSALESAVGAGPRYAAAHLHLARAHRELALRAGRRSEGERLAGPAGARAAESEETAEHESKLTAGRRTREAEEHEEADARETAKHESALTAGRRTREAREAGEHATADAEAARESRLALQSVSMAIVLEPANTEALLLRGDLALDAGNTAIALRAVSEALKYIPPGPDRDRALEAYRRLGGSSR